MHFLIEDRNEKIIETVAHYFDSACYHCDIAPHEMWVLLQRKRRKGEEEKEALFLNKRKN